MKTRPFIFLSLSWAFSTVVLFAQGGEQSPAAPEASADVEAVQLEVPVSDPTLVYLPAPAGGQRMLSQEEVVSLRAVTAASEAAIVRKPELSFPVSKPVPRPEGAMKPASFMEGMQVLAVGNEWMVVPSASLLFVPEAKKDYFSTEADQLARDPKPVFVTTFPGSFSSHFKLVEVSVTEAGYSFPAAELKKLQTVTSSIVVAVVSGMPVRMPVKLE